MTTAISLLLLATHLLGFVNQNNLSEDLEVHFTQLADSYVQQAIEELREAQIPKVLTLTNDLGVSLKFPEPMTNQQRVYDLLDSGFEVTAGEIPPYMLDKYYNR